MKIAAVRKHALSLPETTEEPHFDYSSFRVHGKIFVTVPPEEDRIHTFVSEEHRERFLAMHPEFLERLPWGKRIVGLRVMLAKADAAVVKQLVTFAWLTKAPKSLRSAVAEPD
jgi:hypothetical protein